MQTKNEIIKKDLILPPTPEFIERRIHVFRGQKVMIDSDLAVLYQVSTKYFNQMVNRNMSRFPDDFMFQLNQKEVESLRLQFATSKIGRGGRRYLPYAFTELGVAMLSSVLNSDRAIQMNIFIMRSFVKMRRMIADNKDLAHKVDKLELEQMKQEIVLAEVYSEVKKFMNAPMPKSETDPVKRKIGFARE